MKGILLRAKTSGEVLEMIYQPDKGQISHRKVKIIEIYSDSVKAYCLLRKMPRVFKINNILSIGPSRRVRGA